MAVEACPTGHNWGRVAQRSSHDFRLVPVIYVKPFVKWQKNDAAIAKPCCGRTCIALPGKAPSTRRAS